MKIKWKTIRYGHLEEFRQLGSKITNNELTDRDATLYILSFVLEWDFLDPDTGQPFEATPETLNLLSISQYKYLCAEFNEQMGSEVIVPKTSASPPSSGSTRSKKKSLSYQSRPNGLT